MCHVATGKDVTTKADLQNLVTSLILKQEQAFTSEKIAETAKQELSGSAWDTKERVIIDLIRKTLFILVAIDHSLLYAKGKYIMRNLLIASTNA